MPLVFFVCHRCVRLSCLTNPPSSARTGQGGVRGGSALPSLRAPELRLLRTREAKASETQLQRSRFRLRPQHRQTALTGLAGARVRPSGARLGSARTAPRPLRRVGRANVAPQPDE
ncbi:hypothetical protein T492DRAFT_20348 [Pavlovales sp. CCMP2436]|nr:hypothetical protein T492DRAFT_20348 [Pavlovales sp. CCMP2436]